MKKLLIPLAILVVAGGITGGFIWQKYYSGESVMIKVDRGLSDEDRARIEAKIVEMREKIGDDRTASDLNLWLDFGNWQSLLGDLRGARDTFRIATELNPLSSVAWHNLGTILAEMGDRAGADAAYRTMMTLDPPDNYISKYADFLREYYPERTAEYERLLQESIARLGQKPWLIALLARFYEEEGRLAEAKSHLEVLIRLLPNDPGARQDLERVERKMTGDR